MIRDAISLLKKNYAHNYKAGEFYKKCLQYEKKMLFKNLLSRLHAQKLAFNESIQEHLLKLSRLDIREETKSLLTDWKSPADVCLNSYNSREVEHICLNLETSSYNLCQESLRKINNGEIRDTLLHQRQQIHQLLEEMKIIDRYMI